MPRCYAAGHILFPLRFEVVHGFDLRPLNLSFREAVATRNLNNFELIRFLPAVEMTENSYYPKVSSA